MSKYNNPPVCALLPDTSPKNFVAYYDISYTTNTLVGGRRRTTHHSLFLTNELNSNLYSFIKLHGQNGSKCRKLIIMLLFNFIKEKYKACYYDGILINSIHKVSYDFTWNYTTRNYTPLHVRRSVQRMRRKILLTSPVQGSFGIFTTIAHDLTPTPLTEDMKVYS